MMKRQRRSRWLEVFQGGKILIVVVVVIHITTPSLIIPVDAAAGAASDGHVVAVVVVIKYLDVIANVVSIVVMRVVEGCGGPSL
jgi:hypothetical protein